MYTESALRFGPSATLLPDKTCYPQKLTRYLSQRLSLPRGWTPERAFDGKTSATLEYHSTRKSAEADLIGQKLYTAGNFDTAALSLGQSEGTKQNPLSGSLSSQNEERMKNLQALAGLRQGKVIGDGSVYRQTFVIRSYEVGSDGKASMDMIVGLFQEVAINHFSFLGLGGKGFGNTPKMDVYSLIWVITKLHVEVERYPTWPEAIYVDSWTDNAGKNGMMIEWLLREHATGKVIARGTSKWAMMNHETRRLSKLPDDVRAEIQPTFVTDKRRALGDATLERIPQLDNTAKNITSDLIPAKSDLDGNKHVNNIAYIRWIMKSIPETTWENHELNCMTLEYRRECKEGDVAESLTDLEHSDPTSNSAESPPLENSTEPANRSANGNGHVMSTSYGNGAFNGKDNDTTCCADDMHFIHLLRMQANGGEIVRGRTVWQHKK